MRQTGPAVRLLKTAWAVNIKGQEREGGKEEEKKKAFENKKCQKEVRVSVKEEREMEGKAGATGGKH